MVFLGENEGRIAVRTYREAVTTTAGSRIVGRQGSSFLTGAADTSDSVKGSTHDKAECHENHEGDEKVPHGGGAGVRALLSPFMVTFGAFRNYSGHCRLLQYK